MLKKPMTKRPSAFGHTWECVRCRIYFADDGDPRARCPNCGKAHRNRIRAKWTAFRQKTGK